MPEARAKVSRDALSPFSRGDSASLAGRTILQILPRLDAGGDERATLDVAAALVRAGARALVASERGALTSELQALGGVHIAFPAATKNPLAMAFNIRKLARLIEDERVDLAHVRSRAPAWVALGACRTTQRPLVTSFLSLAGGSSALSARYDSVMAQGDLVIVASEYAAERIAQRYPGARARLRIVRTGADFAKFNPEAVSRARVAKVRESWGVAAHERVILAPAPISPARGQAVLVEAARVLRDRGLDDVRAVLAGESARGGAAARDLGAMIHNRGLADLVALAPACADLPAAMLAASLVALPALEAEGLGRAAVEAQAMGALTVVSDIGPAAEIVIAPPQSAPEARTGWRIPTGDPQALAGAIDEALGLGASAREALRRRARAHILTAYSVEAMTRDTLKVYKEALGR